MKAWAPVFIAVSLVILLAGIGVQASPGPHGFISDTGQCETCHIGVPRRVSGGRPLRFQRDFVSLCLGCHKDKDLSTLHPVDIRPGAQVPEYLPLDEYGTMTCVTCHNPHEEYETDVPYVAQSLSKRLLSLFSPSQRHRTFYLRRRNDQGQLCLACHKRSLLAADGFHVKEASVLDRYAGSTACSPCHQDIYREWQKTPHARFARDVRKNPGAVIADFSSSPPFPRDEVVYALGSHWTQRYVVNKGGKLLVKAAIWSAVQGAWDTSYWVDKPWTQYCQGCHTTGFEIKEQPRFIELGVGCEACHGPGRAHVDGKGSAPIVNPGKLEAGRRDMVCEACHTSGHDRSGQFRFPLGFSPGKDLTSYFKGLLPKPGQDNQTFAGDETPDDRHRQWRFWVDTFMEAKGLACEVCKNFRSQLDRKEKFTMTPSEYCLSCHRATWPKTAVHLNHSEKSVHCHQCHSPMLDRERKGYSIHDHKFLFAAPEGSQSRTPRDACAQCHKSVASSRQ